MAFSRALEEQAPPKLLAPPGTCDTHMHFYNARFATAPTATFTPDDAWIEDYRRLQAFLGLERLVVVQPTTYGLDNRCTLEAAAAFGAAARCVVVVDERTGAAELRRLSDAGARGARFHMLPGGAVPWEILETVAARIQPFGWHIQLQCNGRELAERAEMLKRLPGTLVIDHLGRFTPPVGRDHPSFRVLLELLESGRCWVKLSAPYESSQAAPPDYADTREEARALVAAAPERMLWASNWPHPSQQPAPSDAALLDLLLDWVDDEATRQRILVDNPAVLYGFDG